jgi:nucleotide-binding universal stress UspA family protein
VNAPKTSPTTARRPAPRKHGDDPAFRKIVVAVDGSPLAELALPYVESLGKAPGVELVLINAVPSIEMVVAGSDPGFPGAPSIAIDAESIVESSRREAREYLGRLVNRLKGRGVNAIAEVVDGRAADRIVKLAVDKGADLIAITTHGRGGLGRVVFGSVADAVVRSAPCPVLLVPAHAKRSATKNAKRS